MKVLRKICDTQRKLVLENPRKSRDAAALLRVMLRGVQDRSCFNRKRSINNNLEIFHGLFVDYDGPASFRRFDDVQHLLFNGKGLECQHDDVVEVRERLRKGPFAFQKELYDAWPAAIVNALQYDVVCDIWAGRSVFQPLVRKVLTHGRHQLYEQIPSLRADTGNGLQVLLCHCMGMEDGFQAVRDWGNGPSWYEHTKKRLHGSGTAEQIALTVTALHVYAWLAGRGNKILAVTSYNYLIALVQKRMAGEELRRKAWMNMAGSIKEFLGAAYMPPSFVEEDFTGVPPLSYWPTGLVDLYQKCAGNNGWVLVEGV